MKKGKGSIGRPSQACGTSMSEAGFRAILPPAELLLIVIARYCSHKSRGFIPFYAQSYLRLKSYCAFHSTSEAEQSARYGQLCTAIVASSTRKTTGSWAHSANSPPRRIKL